MDIELTNTNTPSLDIFLNKVERDKTDQLFDQQDQKIIAFDRSKGVASIKKVSFWESIMGSSKAVECYLVDIYGGASVRYMQTYLLSSEKFGKKDLKIVLTVGALGGRETRLVERLVKRNNPSETLKELLCLWTTEAFETFGEEIFTDFPKFQGYLSSALRLKGENYGLRLSASAAQKKIDPEAELTIETYNIRLQPKGYSDFILMGFDAVLVPDLASNVHVHANDQLKDKFNKLLVSWFQEYIRTEITYNKLHESLHGRVRDELINYWNDRLRSKNMGWKVSELGFRSSDILLDNFRFEQLVVNVALKEDSIPLTNTITLTLDDPQKYKNARIDNIENWLKEKLSQTTQSVLTGVAFAELVSRIGEYESIIKNDLDKEARQIGYKVKYLLTSGPIGKVKPSFNFEFDEEEQDYDTDSNDRVKLNVIVNGRVKDFNYENLRRILSPNMELATEMKKEAIREVRKFILRCKPDEYYLDFDTRVGPELETRIREMLYRQFNVAKDVDIVLRWQGSSLIGRLRQLMKGFTETLVRYRNDELVFRIKFNVEGVHKQLWGRFAALGFEDEEEEKKVLAKEVKVAVENIMRQEFDNLPNLANTQLTDLVKSFAVVAAKTDIVENTGLAIRISNVEQVSNTIVDYLDEVRSKIAIDRINSILSEIKLLDEKIRKYNNAGLLPEKINELEKRKKTLEQQIMGKDYDENQLRAQIDSGLSKKWLDTGEEPPS